MIAGADGVYYPATAHVVDWQTIEVSRFISDASEIGPLWVGSISTVRSP
jgi:hypothetical protein